ncbi:transporter substrate-binding domain-containing protein [Burkholderia sp. Ac-20379]|uniref:transporter substrate-binding domain-containing protein n=1 Tax=Burkholderia sp. Ac-20379 TaxID=2703900 RepID=UPI0019801992|nr:transporter substrate-binding domain-containing protein [Burkholderia sp. Ac-20379]MBN3725089.1 transporter substrate-binding domain-containing protein [Burkholderia sp. Ac-20379]
MTSSHRDPIRIGVLLSETGVTAPIERSQQRATRFATEEINDAGGIDGREVELVLCDPASRPARYAELLTGMIANERIRVVVGCYMSSTRKAVLPVLERHNALLLYPTLYEGFECSRNVIYTGAAPNQNSFPLADYMLRNHGKRVFMIGSDYIYPYEANRVMSDLVFENGGEKAGEIYLPLNAGYDAYRDAMKKIVAAAPDFIYSTVVGIGMAHIYRAYAEAGLDPARCPIATLSTTETEFAAMGAEIGEGHITSSPYFQSVDTPANHDVIARFRRRFGDDVVTDMCWEAAYFQMHLLADAMRRTGGDEPDALLRTLPGLEFDAPQGRVKIDEQNHHTYLRPRIGRLNAHAQFDILQEAPDWVRPDPFVIAFGDGSGAATLELADGGRE